MGVFFKSTVNSELRMFSAALALALVATTLALPFGVPEEACVDMTPSFVDFGGVQVGHIGEPQTGNAPYTLTADEGVSFKGMFVQETGAADGFMEIEFLDNTLQLNYCSDPVLANGVTHADNEDKTSATFYWNIRDLVEPPKFAATVVQNQNTFWTKIAPSA